MGEFLSRIDQAIPADCDPNPDTSPYFQGVDSALACPDVPSAISALGLTTDDLCKSSKSKPGAFRCCVAGVQAFNDAVFRYLRTRAPIGNTGITLVVEEETSEVPLRYRAFAQTFTQFERKAVTESDHCEGVCGIDSYKNRCEGFAVLAAAVSCDANYLPTPATNQAPQPKSLTPPALCPVGGCQQAHPGSDSVGQVK